MANPNGYELSRNWFDWCFENPELVSPNHTALYFFAIEHCNRLGWKEKFGFPMEMAKNAIGIKNYRTYSKTFEDLVSWGFFEVHERSKNQWSANIIAIAKNTKANTKALDKAMQKHSQKQVHGIVGIDKQIQNNTVNNKPLTGESHFNHIVEFYSTTYDSQLEPFKKTFSKTEYESFQKFISALFRDFTIEQLVSQWDKCLNIGDWKNSLQAKPYMILKPAIEKAIAAQVGNRNQMALRIKTFTNGLLDEKVFVR